MGANTNQQILKYLYKNWKSYFKAIKEYYKNSCKFISKPKLPKYKDKDGKFIVNFPCNNKSNIKEGYFYFPKFDPPLGVDMILQFNSETKVSMSLFI